MVRTCLGERKAFEMVIDDASGERFRRLREEVGGRAPEHQEAARTPGPIRKHTQSAEQVGPSLHFVQNHQAPQGLQGQRRVGEAREILIVLEVEGRHRPAIFVRNQARQGGLPTCLAPMMPTTG